MVVTLFLVGVWGRKEGPPWLFGDHYKEVVSFQDYQQDRLRQLATQSREVVDTGATQGSGPTQSGVPTTPVY